MGNCRENSFKNKQKNPSPSLPRHSVLQLITILPGGAVSWNMSSTEGAGHRSDVSGTHLLLKAEIRAALLLSQPTVFMCP